MVAGQTVNHLAPEMFDGGGRGHPGSPAGGQRRIRLKADVNPALKGAPASVDDGEQRSLARGIGLDTAPDGHL